MNVYYDVNFWGKRDNQEALKPIVLNKSFVWEDLSGFIPAIYVGEQGVVMDICVQISTDKVKAFLDKWKEKSDSGELSEAEYEQCSRENPLNVDFSVEFKCNGKVLESDYSCGVAYAPIVEMEDNQYEAFEMDEMPDEEKEPKVEEQLAEAYGCDKTKCWYFYRAGFLWNKDSSFNEAGSIAGEGEKIINSVRIENIEVKFIADYKEYLGDIFETDTNCQKRTIEILSPITKDCFTITVHNMEQQELQTDMFPNRNEFEYPGNLAVLYYELEPKLLWQEFRIKDADKGDNVRRLNKNKKSAAAIIGGSDGPTAVFLASKKADGAKICTANSSMYFEPVESIRWQPVFSRKEREDLKIKIFDLG